MKLLLLIIFFNLQLFSANPVPVIDFSVTAPDTPNQLVSTLNILIVLTLLTLAPSMIMVMTSFVRIIIVFGFLRMAMGTNQSPPTQLLVSLAMVLTFFIMEPIAKHSYEVGVKPYLAEEIGYAEAFKKGVQPFKEFMIRNTRETDIALFYRI